MIGRKKDVVDDPIVEPTIRNDVANFLLLHQKEVLYMSMLGYTFLHGSKVFAAVPKSASVAFKLVSMILACTGGGIIVPIFINSIPVPIANDSYMVSILTSFAIHHYCPIVREVVEINLFVKALVIILYETLRAKVVVTFTLAANAAIAPSVFSFALFGPIMCGTLSGCGGAFLPLNKGLTPIENGMQAPMITACVGATMLHLFMNTNLSEGIIDAKEKAHVHLALFFIFTGLIKGLSLSRSTLKVKKE